MSGAPESPEGQASYLAFEKAMGWASAARHQVVMATGTLIGASIGEYWRFWVPLYLASAAVCMYMRARSLHQSRVWWSLARARGTEP